MATWPSDGIASRSGWYARLEPDGPHLRAVQRLGRIGDALELPVLLAEGLHDPHAVDVLVDDLGHVALALLTVPGGGEDPPAHAVGHDQEQRGDDQADHGQQRRQVQHDAERQQHQQHVAAHDREEAEEALDERRVRVGPGDELAGRHPVQVVEVQRLQVVVHVVAQVVLHLEGDPAAAVAADVGEAEAGRGERHQQQQPRPQRRRVVEDDLVHDLAGDERDDRLAGAAEDGASRARITSRRWRSM